MTWLPFVLLLVAPLAALWLRQEIDARRRRRGGYIIPPARETERCS